MRSVIAGFKSEGERARRQASRQETAEKPPGPGIPIGRFTGAGSVPPPTSPGLQLRLAEAEEAEAREAAAAERQGVRALEG